MPRSSTYVIAMGAVTTAKIADLNVTTDKLAANAVTSAKLADEIVLENLYPSHEVLVGAEENNLAVKSIVVPDRFAGMGENGVGVENLQFTENWVVWFDATSIRFFYQHENLGPFAHGILFDRDNVKMDNVVVENVKVTGKLDTRSAAENAFMDNVVVENLYITGTIGPPAVAASVRSGKVTVALVPSQYYHDALIDFVPDFGTAPEAVILTFENQVAPSELVGKAWLFVVDNIRKEDAYVRVENTAILTKTHVVYWYAIDIG